MKVISEVVSKTGRVQDAIFFYNSSTIFMESLTILHWALDKNGSYPDMFVCVLCVCLLLLL